MATLDGEQDGAQAYNAVFFDYLSPQFSERWIETCSTVSEPVRSLYSTHFFIRKVGR